MKKFMLMVSCFLVYNGFTPAFAETLTLAIVGVQKDTKGFEITQTLADAVATRAGIQIKIVALPGKRALESLRNGKIDGDFSRVAGFGTDIPGLIQVAEPMNSHPYLAYAIRKDIKIKNWKSLLPYKVTYLRGWKSVEGPLLPIHKNLHPLNTPKSALQFVAKGRADVFICIPFIADPLLASPELKNEGIVALQPPLSVLNLFIYLAPKHAEVAKRMSLALKAIKKDGTHTRIR